MRGIYASTSLMSRIRKNEREGIQIYQNTCGPRVYRNLATPSWIDSSESSAASVAVKWMPTPTSTRLIASFEDAYSIFDLIRAVSGDLKVSQHPPQIEIKVRVHWTSNHLLLLLSCSHVPRQKDDLAGGTPVLRGQVQVHDRVSTVARDLRQLVGHVLVRLTAGPRGLDHDLRVVHDLVDKVAEIVRRALQFKVVKLRDHFIIDTDTGRLGTDTIAVYTIGERKDQYTKLERG